MNSTSEQCYLEFCRQDDCQPLPGSDITLSYYTASPTQRIRPASVRVYMSAVRSLHLEMGLLYSEQQPSLLGRVMNGIALRRNASDPTRWHAITSSPRLGNDKSGIVVGLPRLPALRGTDLVDEVGKHQNRHGKTLPRGLATEVNNRSIRMRAPCIPAS